MKYEVIRTDVLVIGAGMAGCRAAIEARKNINKVILINQGIFGYSGSTFHPELLTHGRGIAVSLGDCGFTDTPDSLFNDAMVAGEGLSDPALLKILVKETPNLTRELGKKGVKLTHKKKQTLEEEQPDFGRQVRGVGLYDPSNYRKVIMNWVKNMGIKVINKTICLKLLGDKSRCKGALAISKKGLIFEIVAGATILATGGSSNLYGKSLALPDQVGVGHAIALEIGAELINMEFFQSIVGMTKPYKVAFPEIYLSLLPKVTNGLGEEFIAQYLPHGIKVREVLLRRSRHGPFCSKGLGKFFDLSLMEELRSGNGTESGGIIVDFRDKSDKSLNPSYFPFWRKWVNRVNLKIFSQPVELSIFAHACNGGIKVNSNTETCVPGLFACGEVMGGPHGANRIGGMQMAAALVFGKRAGYYAAQKTLREGNKIKEKFPTEELLSYYSDLTKRENGISPDKIMKKLQDGMWRYVMIDKNEEGLRKNLNIIKELKDCVKNMYLEKPEQLFTALSLPKALMIAESITKIAILRKESRGPHYRSDFTMQNDDSYKHRYLCDLKDASKLRFRRDII